MKGEKGKIKGKIIDLGERRRQTGIGPLRGVTRRNGN